MEKAEGSAAFVGIDAHRRHCRLKAIGKQDEILLAVEVPTQASALRGGAAGQPVWTA